MTDNFFTQTSSKAVADLVEGIGNSSNWQTCRDNHMQALPEDILDGLSTKQKMKLQKFEGVVLEWLPASKRMKVEIAVKNGFLNMERINNTNKSFVSERGRDTVLGLFGKPYVKIKEFFIR